jgi:hypothetical protein
MYQYEILSVEFMIVRAGDIQVAKLIPSKAVVFFKLCRHTTLYKASDSYFPENTILFHSKY